MANPFFETPKNRRLRRDFEEMKALLEVSSILSFEVKGKPPDTYKIRFDGNRLGPDGVVTDGGHEIEVRLGSSYPQAMPSIKWQTPIMHPNISGGNPCFGTFIMNPRVKLVELIEILWDMARMSTYNPYGGYGGKDEWQVLRKNIGFPIDNRILADKAPQVEQGGKPDEGEPDIVIMSGAGGVAPSQQWAKKAVEQYLQSRELDHGSSVYTGDEWHARGERYGKGSVVTVTTEGPLGHLLNGYVEEGSEELINDWDRFLKTLGLYWELGYAWSVHLYPIP